MKIEEFEDLAWKVILGEASAEEEQLVAKACEASAERRTQLARWRRDYSAVSEAFEVTREYGEEGETPPIPDAVLQELMQKRAQAAASESSHPGKRSWWSRPPGWISLAAVAFIGVAIYLGVSRMGPPRSEVTGRLTASSDPRLDSVRKDGAAGAPTEFPALSRADVAGGPALQDTLAPDGRISFLDPLVRWPNASPGHDRLVVSVPGQGVVAEIQRVEPPADFSSLLAAYGMVPKPGDRYDLTLRRTGGQPRAWSFTISENADVFPAGLDDAALIEAAAAAAQRGERGDALQYWWRASAEARAGDRGHEVEAMLRRAEAR